MAGLEGLGLKHWCRLCSGSEWQSHHPLTPLLIIQPLHLHSAVFEQHWRTLREWENTPQISWMGTGPPRKINQWEKTRWVNTAGPSGLLRATRVKIEFPRKWCNPLVRVTPRCYYLNLGFINPRWSRLMTRFPPCPSCPELPADLGRLPASVCKPFAAGMYKQAVKIGFGPETYKTDRAVKQRVPSPPQPAGGGPVVLGGWVAG